MKSIPKKQNNSIKKLNKFQKYLLDKKIKVEHLKANPRSSINAPKLLNSIVSAVHLDNKTYSKIKGVKSLISIDIDSQKYLAKKYEGKEECDYSLVLNKGKISELGLRLILSILNLSYRSKSKTLSLSFRKLNRITIGNKGGGGGRDLGNLKQQLEILGGIFFVGTVKANMGEGFSIKPIHFPLLDFSQVSENGGELSITLSSEIYNSMCEDEKFFAVFYDDNYVNLKSKSARILYTYIRTYDKGYDNTCINISQIFDRTDISKDSNYKSKLKKLRQEINTKCKDDIFLQLDFKKNVLTINYKDKVGSRKNT